MLLIAKMPLSYYSSEIACWICLYWSVSCRNSFLTRFDNRNNGGDGFELGGVIYLQGIAKKLVGAALREAAKKREMRYNDIKKVGKGIRRHLHDDITVIVIYLNHQKGRTSGRFKHSAVGYTTAPVDIFSNADEAMEELQNHGGTA